MTEIAELRAKVEELTEENRQLREVIYSDVPSFGYFSLTATQSRIFAALYRARAVVAYRALHLAANCRNSDACPKDLVKAHIHHMRRKLAAHGISINVVWGLGYEFPAASRLTIDRLIPEELRASFGLVGGLRQERRQEKKAA